MSKHISNRSRLMTLSGVLGVMFTITPNTLAQEPYSDCGFLFLEAEDCLVFYPGDVFPPPFPTPGVLLDSTGEFGHMDYVYVSGLIESCGSFCPVESCLQDNVIEVCPVCGDGLVGGGEQCDDDNLEEGDGCSSTCTVEQGFECTGEPSVCAIPPIPAVSQWGLCVMALLLMTTGTILVNGGV